jgi:DNA-binding response OmpR family regulator
MNKKILLIEDNPKHRFLLEDMLDEAGYKVKTAENGDEVEKEMEGNAPFDLLMVDIAVPGFDAVKFIEQYNEMNRILVVSAYVEEVKDILPEKQRIKKPFDCNELMSRVEEIFKEEVSK